MASKAPLRSAVELVAALDNDELGLVWQGIFDLTTGSLSGVEALLRWAHPMEGMLKPDRFLPAAEGGGLASAMTSRVLDLALQAQLWWRRSGWSVPISINVSPNDVRPPLVYVVADALEAHDADPSLVTLEITEQHCPLELDEPRSVLVALARLGVRLSLDDFGMGDSSLLRLQHLHFDELKIDRGFVAGLHRVPTNRSITGFISGLAHDLGMKVIAEGVEEKEVLDELEAIGVDSVQGYYLHRPCPAPVAAMLFARSPSSGLQRHVS